MLFRSYAQLVQRPIFEEQVNALVGAARLLDEEKVPWPPMVEEVLMELAKSLDSSGDTDTPAEP